MILVIGGSSFIGAYTVKAFLDAGYDVIATGRNPRFQSHYESLGVPYLSFDLGAAENISKLPSENIDCVVLLAALLPANSESNLINEDNAASYISINTLGTANILAYCLRNNIPKLISTTSYADVQNNWSPHVPITEKTQRDFLLSGDHAAYVISKNAATDLLLYYNQQHQMRNIIFRLPPVYGVGPHGSLLVNGIVRKSGIQIFIDQAKNLYPITVFGNPDVKRDIVYVKDVATAFVQAYESSKASGLYNIGSGVSTSLLEQANIISSVFAPSEEKQSMVKVDTSKDNGISPYLFDITKAKIDFNYNPKYSDFQTMMKDWKKEETGPFSDLFLQD